MPNTVYTIGHSNHAEQVFVDLLRVHGIQAVADVRSSPYSSYNPHFDRETLRESLRRAEIQYVFLGKALGARSDDPRCYLKGKVRFDRLAATPIFQTGIERIVEGAVKIRIAMMCAEKEPLECHRTILVARHVAAAGAQVRHILADGGLELHEDTMARVMKLHRLRTGEPNLFLTPDDFLDQAYRLQEQRIAFDSRATDQTPPAA